MDMLAFKAPIKFVIARVPLIHLLASWPSSQPGFTLPCPSLQAARNIAFPHVKVPSLCPLVAQGWYTELNHW